MLTRKTEWNWGRNHLVRDSRAGVIPESSAAASEIRARMKIAVRTLSILAANTERPSCASENRAITELLTDLRHYCYFKGSAYDELDTAATELYAYEGNLAI